MPVSICSYKAGEIKGFTPCLLFWSPPDQAESLEGYNMAEPEMWAGDEGCLGLFMAQKMGVMRHQRWLQDHHDLGTNWERDVALDHLDNTVGAET